jgi:tRNA A-37 threonylcarbamoyl transferase component Bud32
MVSPTLFADTASPKIKQLYDRIHQAGVVHGDIQLRHIRRRGDGLCLIDFDHAYQVDPGGLQREQERVKLNHRLARAQTDDDDMGDFEHDF